LRLEGCPPSLAPTHRNTGPVMNKVIKITAYTDTLCACALPVLLLVSFFAARKDSPAVFPRAVDHARRRGPTSGSTAVTLASGPLCIQPRLPQPAHASPHPAAARRGPIPGRWRPGRQPLDRDPRGSKGSPQSKAPPCLSSSGHGVHGNASRRVADKNPVNAALVGHAASPPPHLILCRRRAAASVAAATTPLCLRRSSQLRAKPALDWSIRQPTDSYRRAHRGKEGVPLPMPILGVCKELKTETRGARPETIRLFHSHGLSG
jgi:hypothetical protein